MKRFIDGEEPEEKSAGNHAPSEVTFAPLAYFPNMTEAGMVCELLVNNGIRALLRGASFGALEPLRLPGGYSEISLLVAQPDFMRAQQLYQAFFAHPLLSSELPADDEESDDE